MPRESKFQKQVIERLEETFPGCVVIKNDPRQLQGIPDLLVLYRDTWAGLEVKRSEDESTQPNQPYYVDLFNEMSYASFIFPENEERVFDDLQLTFGSRR